MKNKNFDKYKGYASNQDKNQPEHVLKLFLNFEKNSASCSYKLGSYKKKRCRYYQCIIRDVNYGIAKRACK